MNWQLLGGGGRLPDNLAVSTEVEELSNKVGLHDGNKSKVATLIHIEL